MEGKYKASLKQLERDLRLGAVFQKTHKPGALWASGIIGFWLVSAAGRLVWGGPYLLSYDRESSIWALFGLSLLVSWHLVAIIFLSSRRAKDAVEFAEDAIVVHENVTDFMDDLKALASGYGRLVERRRLQTRLRFFNDDIEKNLHVDVFLYERVIAIREMFSDANLRLISLSDISAEGEDIETYHRSDDYAFDGQMSSDGKLTGNFSRGVSKKYIASSMRILSGAEVLDFRGEDKALKRFARIINETAAETPQLYSDESIRRELENDDWSSVRTRTGISAHSLVRQIDSRGRAMEELVGKELVDTLRRAGTSEPEMTVAEDPRMAAWGKGRTMKLDFPSDVSFPAIPNKPETLARVFLTEAKAIWKNRRSL